MDWTKDLLIFGENVQETDLTLAEWKDTAKPAPKPLALTDATWPGVVREANTRRDPDTVVAGASDKPWVDANGYLIHCLHAIAPKAPALLAQRPKNLVSWDSYELALIETRVWGGNAILARDAGWREAIEKKDAKAVAAWESFQKTAQWLTANAAVFGRPVLPAITMAIEPASESAEHANLLTRHGGSPALVSFHNPPPPDPSQRLCVVTVGVSEPPPALAKRWLAHAQAGSALVAETTSEKPWWKVPGLKPVKEQDDRIFYTYGRGQIVGYKAKVEDPSEFGLDLIDIVTHRSRALRFWDAPTAVGIFTPPYVILVNYGAPRRYDFPLRAQGNYGRARLLRPEAAPLDVPAVKRASTTEVRLPNLQRVAIVELG